MRILIVEDEVIVALTMEDALSSAGHTVVGIARDEKNAVRLAKRERPDLALVDLYLAHDSSGADTARQMRETLGVPSVFVSGNPVDCRRLGSTAGVFGCLRKPFTEQDLLDAVAVAEAVLARQMPNRVPSGLELYLIL